jgi:hypothetical protein
VLQQAFQEDNGRNVALSGWRATKNVSNRQWTFYDQEGNRFRSVSAAVAALGGAVLLRRAPGGKFLCPLARDESYTYRFTPGVGRGQYVGTLVERSSDEVFCSDLRLNTGRRGARLREEAAAAKQQRSRHGEWQPAFFITKSAAAASRDPTTTEEGLFSLIEHEAGVRLGHYGGQPLTRADLPSVQAALEANPADTFMIIGGLLFDGRRAPREDFGDLMQLSMCGRVVQPAAQLGWPGMWAFKANTAFGLGAPFQCNIVVTEPHGILATTRKIQAFDFTKTLAENAGSELLRDYAFGPRAAAEPAATLAAGAAAAGMAAAAGATAAGAAAAGAAAAGAAAAGAAAAGAAAAGAAAAGAAPAVAAAAAGGARKRGAVAKSTKQAAATGPKAAAAAATARTRGAVAKPSKRAAATGAKARGGKKSNKVTAAARI